jgi:hypothetical protein
MRVTLEHNRSKDEVMRGVDRSVDELARGNATLPVQVTVKERSWQGAVMSFALAAKFGVMSSPIKGTVEVTEHEVIIDADLGMLGRFVSEKMATEMFQNRFKGLLN